MAKAAKEAPAQNKALEADILNEGAKVAGATPVNQQEVKDAAQTLGNAPATGPINNAGQSVIGAQGTPAPEQQEQAPVTNQANADDWGEKERDAAIVASNEAKADRLKPQPFLVPAYLNEHPPVNQEEMDAIAEFLKGYRARVHAPVSAPVDELEKTYGQGYVVAKKGTDERPFTRIAWDRMGGNKNQDGWREVVKVPQEVKDLQAKKAANG